MVVLDAVFQVQIKLLLCIDPSPEMKLVEETSERYCSEEVEVVVG